MEIARLKQPNVRGSAPTIFRISIVVIVILAILISAPKVQAGSSITHRSIAGWTEDVFSDGSFFSVHYLTIIDYSTLPDVWKATDPYESYRHYYHIDVPHTREQYLEGVLPWTVDDNFSLLVQSLQTGNWDVAAQLSGVISHYICDASIPLHATQYYNPGGKHGAFEWEINRHLGEISIPEYVPLELENIFTAVMGMLKESYGYSGEVSYWLTQGILWNDNLKRIMENRLRSAVELTANVWYTAMIRSGLMIQAPALIDPENGENTISMPTLTWAPVEGINAYDLQLSTDNNFTSNVITIKDLTANTYIPKDPLAYGTWYWRVRSGDNSTHVGLWSQACNFTVLTSYYTTPPFEWTSRVSITDVANGDDVGAWVTLPFEFPFWGEPKTRVWVCSNGFLIFDPTSETVDYTNSLDELKTRWMIAPFWNDLMTNVAGGIVSDPGVYVDSYDDKVVITWEVTRYGNSSDSIKFQVILYSNGDIRINLDNATNFWNFYPTLGVSRGDGISYFDITGERGTNKSWFFRLIGVGPTPRTPIYIYSNAGFTLANGVVAGSGTESDPYIIENWRISAKNNYGIRIYNTTAYFIIRNCYIYDGWTGYYIGIYLYNVRNGKISNNSVENNSYGIYLYSSSNNTIENSIMKNNRWSGINLYSSSNNIITNSTASGNGDGIRLSSSSNNIITNSTASGNGTGIYLYSSSNNTVENNISKNNRYEGINLDSSSNNIVDNNIMVNNSVGILCQYSSTNNSISNNLMANNRWPGIDFYYSSNNIVDNNIMMSNGAGAYLGYSTNNSISNNLMANNDGDGICLEYSDSNSISNNLMENNYRGIDFWSPSNNNLILNNTCRSNYYYGIFLQDSSNNNTISNNTCESNPIGIYLGYSDDTLISNNTVRNNIIYGIEIDSSGNNTLDNNTFSNNSDGIYLYYAKENNFISNNTIEGNVRGIEIVRSPNNLISNNQVVGNSTGIWIRNNSNYNRTFYNNFVNNSDQARDESSNYWDNGYPSGGNYWSDYTGVDNYRGENQDILGSDGIGDTPYDIYGGTNQDRYPLMRNTPPGENVQVTPAPSVSVTFSRVTVRGNTTATTSTTGPAPPTGYRIVGTAGLPLYYDITTTGTYSGTITICISYDETQVAGSEENLRLMHKVDNLWEDITTSVDTVNNKIYGTTTTLSIFIIAEPSPPPPPPPPPPAAPVGGIAFPADKLALLAPWIALAALIVIVAISVAVYWRRR